MKAGPLTLERREAALADVRWGGLDVVSWIGVTVRGGAWDTLRPRVRDVSLEQRADGFAVRIDAVHGNDEFASVLVAECHDDGTIEVELRGEALREFVQRRIGISVLHPWASHVGAAYVASGIGPSTSGTLPAAIGPQPIVNGNFAPLIAAFTRIAFDLPAGVTVTFTFAGEDDGFELEDQRNWTDASFKTYPTPLARSDPRTIRRGERREQRVTIGIDGPPPPSRSDGEGSVDVTIGSARGTVPSIGLTAPRRPVDPERVRALRPSHLRVAVPVPTEQGSVPLGIDLARATAVPLEVCLLLGDDADAAPALASLGEAPIGRVLVLRRDGGSTGASFVSALGEEVAGGRFPIVGGTSSHFSELNRAVPDVDGLDGVAVAISPQMHADDERSMVETLEIQIQVVRQIRSLCRGLPVIVSPVTLAAHVPDVDDPPDPRTAAPFGAAWTVGSIAALAEGGAASITLHEEADRTVLASEPLAEAIALVAPLSGRPLLAATSSDPRRVRCIAAASARPIVVNLTSERQAVRVAGGPGSNGVSLELAPYEVTSVERSRSPR